MSMPIHTGRERRFASSTVTVTDVEVALVRWPEEDSLRRGLAALGRPRLLLVDEGVHPPEPLDHLEDWLRWPPDPSDLMVRVLNLRRRGAPASAVPLVLDGDGLLRRGDQWVAVSEGQLPILRLLLDNLDRVVRIETIAEVYANGGGSQNHASVRTMLSRLGERVRPLGLELVSIRRRGLVLRTFSTER